MFCRKLTCPALPVFVSLAFLASAEGEAQTLYQFGDPTPEEQMYIEFINRARANPGAEGIRLAETTDPDVRRAYVQYRVDLNLMKSEFNAIPAAQPLAPNAALTGAARGHTQWMFDNSLESHEETDPDNTAEERLTDAGYDWWDMAENVYVRSKSVWFGHAGFQVDWGTDEGGMQEGRGHRASIHRANFREIGVGVMRGSKPGIGPQLITQDFAEPFADISLGTGVAYYDLNSNNFYDPGEGIGGLTVTMNGGTHYCMTAAGGGWAFPIPPEAATRQVVFSGLGINQSRPMVIPASTNAKTDFKLAYTPPTVTSTAPSAAGVAHDLTFTAVGGATSYRWDLWNIAPAETERCESLANVIVTTSPGYSVLNTSVKQEGNASFHLANPGVIGTQAIEMKTLFHAEASPSLSFLSLLKNSTLSEHHIVQVKVEGTPQWETVHNQPGGPAEPAFSNKTIPLPLVAGKRFRVRFLLNFPGGSSFGNAGDGYGWFIDAISFTGVSALSNNTSRPLGGTTGSFTPAPGNWLMAVSPVISGNVFPGGIQSFSITAAATGYAGWAASHESTHSLPAGTIANDPEGDHDRDGLANLIEYAFGTSPLTANSPSPVIRPDASRFVIRYVVDKKASDVVLVPLASRDAVNWFTPQDPGAPADFTETVISSDGDLETREAGFPTGSGAPGFLRLKVVRP